MIAAKFVSVCVLLLLTPQQRDLNETGSPIATSLSIQGTAIFADGEPLANLELEFKLSRLGAASTEIDSNSKLEILRCETNAEGSFELKLPKGGKYSAAVVATARKESDSRRWRCSIPELSTDMRGPCELVFENRGRIFIVFLGTSNLTADVKPLIICSTPGSDAQVRIVRRLEADSRGRIVIDGLEQRDYTIEVYCKELSAKSWKQSVTVPPDSPMRATAKIQFPEFKFGTFTAIVVMPDGKTPAANTWVVAQNFDEESNSFGYKELMTDSEGLVSAKMGIGDLQLEYRANPRVDKLQGVAPALFRAKVKPDELTDMGTLRLKAEEEVFAWIDGTIKYSNGQPVEKIIPGGWLYAFESGIPTITVEFSRPDPKLANGSFAIRVEAGRQVKAIGIEGTGQPLGGGLRPKISDEKQILFSLDLSAGERIRRDIVLPMRKDDGKLRVRFDDPSTAKVLLTNGNVVSGSVVNLFIEVSPGVVWRAEGHFEKGFKQFENVPSGECLIIVRSDSGDYVASRTVAADSPQREFVFSQQDVGKLQVAVKDFVRMDSEHFELDLSIDSPLQEISFFGMGLEHPKMKRDAEGSLIVEGIAPGKYRVTVGDRTVQLEQKCEITSLQTTKMQF